MGEREELLAQNMDRIASLMAHRIGELPFIYQDVKDLHDVADILRSQEGSIAHAQSAVISNDEALLRLSANEYACYRWPMDTAEHRAMRAAYMDGAASTLRAPEADDAGAVALKLGDLVKVNENAPYFSDWRDAVLKVVSLRLDPEGGQWVSVIEGNERHRGNGVYDGETTDFYAGYLSALASTDGNTGG